MNRVVITGMGVVSPLGTERSEVWNNLLKGQNGIINSREYDERLPQWGVDVVAPAAPFDLSTFNLQKRKVKKLNMETRMLFYAGLSALNHAGLSFPEETSACETGIVLGTGTAMCSEYCGTEYGDRAPSWFFNTFPNLTLSHFSIAAGITGYGCTMVNACSSSTQAIGHAFQMIQAGKTNVLLAGGTENKVKAPFVSGFSRLNMTTKETDPDCASRPFDTGASGFVIGQGCAMLVLESLDHALKRGAEPLAEVVGYGASLDALSLADADKEGKVRSMKAALKDACLTPKDIQYINAHGTSTRSNDEQEARAIAELFGGENVLINSTKSMTGHSFAASGAIETFVCVQSLRDQKVHPTRNLKNPRRDLNFVKNKAVKAPLIHCMNNTSGIGGINSTLILKRISL